MIRTVAVQGYRSLRDLVLPLGQLSVITGANGSGESSVYRSLRLLADAAQNAVIASLAREGGLSSTFCLRGLSWPQLDTRRLSWFRMLKHWLRHWPLSRFVHAYIFRRTLAKVHLKAQPCSTHRNGCGLLGSRIFALGQSLVCKTRHCSS